MKKIFLLILTSIISFSLLAQNLPQGIAYQAVAVKEGPYSVAGENPQAIYWSNKDIKVRFTILDQYPNPTNIYQESHPVTTDDYGVFNLIIGQGSVLLGDFETIPWELGTAHLQVEIDFDNDDSYTITSFERFWSVPYAFVSKKVKGTNIDSAIQALNDKIIYLKDRDKDTVIGNEGITYKTIDSLNQVLQNKIDALRVNDLDTVVGNEIQTLAIKGDSLSISDGNTVKIDFPSNLDNNPVNEIQTLALIGDSLSISDGNSVKIDFPANLDNDSTNEIQTISLNNDTIHLSGEGGKITLESINKYIVKYQDSINFIPRMIIGFDSDTIWKCPKGVNRIIVELWGAGGGGTYNTRGPSCGCSGCGPSIFPGLSGGKGGYNKRIINVNADTTYKIIIGQGGCLGGRGDTTFFDTLAIAMGGTGGVGSNVRCDYGSYTMKSYRSAKIGIDGQINNWGYDDIYQTTVPSYIPSGIISNQESLNKFSMAKGGSGGTSCVSSRGDNGFIIIRY
mgnify:CR=1 FL=1